MPSLHHVVVFVATGHRLEQLERGGLGGRDEHLAPEVFELREEAGVDGHLVGTRVLQDDHGATLALAPGALTTSDGRTRGGEHRDREVVPMRERVLALRIGHLIQVMAIALGERGDRCSQRGVGQEVVDRGHVSSMARALGWVEWLGSDSDSRHSGAPAI
jgi:hypothetical protein